MLASFGIAAIGIEPWFLPVLVVFLLIGLWGFWQSTRIHGKAWLFIVALVSSAAVVAGRLLEMPVLLWSGTGALSMAYVCDWMMKRKGTKATTKSSSAKNET